MIHINLLPIREIKQRNKAKNEIAAFGAVFALLLAALVVFTLLQSNTIKQRNDTLAQLKKEKQKYTKVIARIKQMEQDKQVLQKRIDIINKLKRSSSLTVHALDEVARITPSTRMWLTSLSQNGSNLKLSGMALDNRTIAKYMDDLSASDFITNVSLASTSLKGYAGRNLKSFSLTCTIAMPKETKPDSTTDSNKN